jgi:hypothetical protein
MTKEKVELDEIFTAFLDGMKEGSGKTYRIWVNAWVRFSHMNGKETLAFKKADPDAKTEKLILAFHDSIGIKTNTARTASAVICGFYTANRINLTFTRSERKRLTDIERVSEDFLFSKSDILKMYEQANLTERYVLMVGKSIGLRASDFVKITYGKFRGLDLTQEAPIFIGETPTGKESVKAYPHLDADAVSVVKAILEHEPNAKNEDRILDYDEESLTQILQRLFEKAHLESGGKTVRFHNLRKYLIDRLSAVTSESQWKQVVGKQISEGAYVSQDQLKEAYARAMPNISVLNGNGLTKKKVENLENALAQAESELSATKTRLEQALKRIEDSENTMSKVIDRLTVLEEVERKKPVKIKEFT